MGAQLNEQEFAHCIRADWGKLDYADIMAGVDHVIAQGTSMLTGWRRVGRRMAAT